MLKLSNLESIGKPVYKFHNNHSVDFDGVDDFIQLGEPISYTQHTISTWVKVSDSDASKTIIDARDANDDGIRIFLTSAEVVTYQLNTSDITSGSAISVDEWHHIVATYDGTTQKLYIDGSLVSSATTSQTISTTTNAEIGARNFSDRANEFLGKIDELAIFDRALTADEVTAIFRIKYGANLVQNGNFDELGSELVVNGDFATDSNWTKGTGWSIANGVASCDGTQSSSSDLKTTSGFSIQNNAVKVTFDLIRTAGTLDATLEGTGQLDLTNLNSSGTYTFIATSSDATARLILRADANFIGSIDNVSVKQVDPNDRFTLGTGWSYGDGVAVHTGSQSLLQQNGIFTIGKTYKISFILSNADSSNYVRLLTSHYPNGGNFTTNGFTSIITTANITQLYIYGVGDVTLDNVMVEEQKYVATNLKLKSTLFNPFTGSTLNLKNYYRFGDGILDKFPLICDMVEPSLGSDLVVNGNFATDSDWDKSSNWTIANNLATSDGSQTGNVSLFQLNSVNNFVTGKIYKVEFTISNYEAGVINPHIRGQASGNVSGNGLKTAYIIAGSSSHGINLYAGSTFAGSISNVTAKEVNGVPGIMTNMTEADITNDVPS